MAIKVRDRKSGITLDQYSDMTCCYSCANCRKPNADGKGMCSISESKVNIYEQNNCCSYSDAELVLCEECDTYLRSLVRHVHLHGLTVNEYKEKHGYNRGTPMTCTTTSELHREHGKINRFIHGQYRTDGSRGKSWSVREEGMLNQEKEYNRRGGYKFIKAMNVKAISITTGSKLTEEHKAKISKANEGKVRSKNQIKNIVKGINMHFDTHTRECIRNTKGQIIQYRDIQA